MSILRRLGALLVEGLVVIGHGVMSVLRGRAVHLIVTGPDLVGMNHVAQILRHLHPEYRSAVDTRNQFTALTVTVDADDITRSHHLWSALGRIRHIIVIAATADPRVMVCRVDERLPHQWPDGWDYRMSFGEGGLKSFNDPGVLPRFEGLDAWRQVSGATVISVSREQLETEPARVVHDIAKSVRGRGAKQVAALLERSASQAHPLPAQANVLDEAESARRVSEQLAFQPGLEARAVALGYPSSTTWKTPAVVASRGTIVAFHTPDEVYRAEAARLQSSLEKLGLDYRFFEITPENNWVRTTLLKPSWIIRAREEISGPLLYIDVDAFVHHDPWPYLEYAEGDMGAVVYRNGQLNSATLWINDTEGAREILRRWKDLADQRRDNDRGDLEPTGDNGDQGVLKQVVLADESSDAPQCQFLRLPVNLAYIFDRTDTYCVGEVAIEQLQVSRESIGHDKRLARRRERLHQLEGAASSTR